MKVCPKCGEEKLEAEYHKSKSRKDSLQGYCKACHSARIIEWRRANPEKHKEALKRISRKRSRINRHLIRQEKETRPCADCKNKFPYYVMQFDHVQGIKRFNVSQCKDKTLNVLMEEISKCELVCANCHAVRTYKRMQQLEEKAE